MTVLPGGGSLARAMYPPIPVRLLDGCRAARDRQVGDQFPFDGRTMHGLAALVGMDHRQGELGIVLLLTDGRQYMDAPISQLDQRRLDATFVVTNFNAMHALDARLLHFICYRVAAIACQAVDAGSDKEMGAEFLRGAKQLIDIALAVVDMHTPCWLAEQPGGLAHVLEPPNTLLALNRHARRIDPALEGSSALELLPRRELDRRDAQRQALRRDSERRMHKQPANRTGPDTPGFVSTTIHTVGDANRTRTFALIGELGRVLDHQDRTRRRGKALARFD